MSITMNVILEDRASTDHLFAEGEEGFGGGYGAPRQVEYLDEVCRRLGLPSIMRFVIVSHEIGDESDERWYDPAEGLACVRGLLTWLAAEGEREQGRMVPNTLWARARIVGPEHYDALAPAVLAEVVADLRTYERELAYAKTLGKRFFLYYSC